MLKFEVLEKRFLEEAVSLALTEYNEEYSVVKDLPRNDYRETVYNLLNDMIDHNPGIVALDGSKVVGFLTCYAPIENFFVKKKVLFRQFMLMEQLRKIGI